ncbi:MAG TPA: ParA family partition ATPase [Rhodospirillales bacterium]|nr:ParA family partition ATPase [Rhodospirillales bacterium]
MSDSEARIISIANQKGGVGKTTITMNVAGTLGRRGAKVCVVDADTQQTALRWSASAPDERPFPAMVMGLAGTEARVHREVQKVVNDYDYILIDCPPSAESPIPQSAFMVSDLVIVPVIPSPPDIVATIGIQSLFENAQYTNETLKGVIVLSRKPGETNIGKACEEALEDFNLPVARTALHNLIGYSESFGVGGTVHDVGSNRSTPMAEVEALTNEILAYLHPEILEKTG